MLRRIVLENYMSHSHTVIEPAEGLTVLVGPNNCGKSAVVSALQTLCTNLTGDFMVRHGQRDTRITVETDDGHIISWQRAGTNVSYVIDGEEISRLRGGVPDRLHELLRLPKVRSAENGEDEFDIHFGTQKSPIFLLNEPEQGAAMFFAASSDAALLLQMQKRHSDKVKDSKRQRERLEQDQVRLDRELSALDPVSPLSERLRQVEQEYEQLKEEFDQLARLTAHVSKVAQEESLWQRQQSELTVLAPLRQLPVLDDVTPMLVLADNIAIESRVTARSAGFESVLLALKPLPELIGSAELDSLVRSLSANADVHAQNAAEVAAVQTLRAVPELADSTALEKLTDDLDRLAQNARDTDRLSSALGTLREAPALVDPAPLANTITQFESCDTAMCEQSRDLASIAEETESVEQAVREWARVNRICKTCGAPLDADRLLSGAHHHE